MFPQTTVYTARYIQSGRGKMNDGELKGAAKVLFSRDTSAPDSPDSGKIHAEVVPTLHESNLCAFEKKTEASYCDRIKIQKANKARYLFLCFKL